MEKDAIENPSDKYEARNKKIKIEVKNTGEYKTKEDYQMLYNYNFWLSPDWTVYIFEVGLDHDKAALQIKSWSSREDLESAGRVRWSWTARKVDKLLFVHPRWQRMTPRQKDFLYYFILYNRDKPEIDRKKYENILQVLDLGWDIIDKAREQMWSSFL